MRREFVPDVSRTMLVLLAPASLVAGIAAGWPGAIGVVVGGVISLASLHWIGRGVSAGAAFFAGGRAHPLWVFALGLRYCLMFGVIASLLGSGLVHPVALVAGLSILPPVLIVLGLRDEHLNS
jgi:hypothetical protein